jgi:hypothetical protein
MHVCRKEFLTQSSVEQRRRDAQLARKDLLVFRNFALWRAFDFTQDMLCGRHSDFLAAALPR